MSKLVTFAKNCGILQTRIDQKEGPHENEFWIFSNTKMNVTNRVEKEDEKWGHLSFVKFPSWVMALNLSRKVHFLQFCADSSKKPKPVRAIYVFHLKVLTTLFEKIYGL